MKRRSIRAVCTAALILCIACLLAACGTKDELADLVNNGYTCKVTIDFCGGLSKGNGTQLYYTREGSLIFRPGADKTGTDEPILSGYHVKEYYVKEKAADGSETERVWNFDSDKVTGDITIYCRWAKNYTVKILYGDNNESVMEVKVPDGTGTVARFSTPKWNGHTLVGYYTDSEYKNPVTFPYKHGLSEDNPDETVYAKFIEGDYELVSKPSDFTTVSAGGCYYLLNDIDMSGVDEVTFPENFSGQIIGNGYKISNLKVTQRQTKNGEYYGLFGRLAGNAEIRDVTFENLQLTIVLDNLQNSKVLYIGALAGKCDDTVKLEGVTIGGKVTIDCAGRTDSDTVMNAELTGAFGEASDESEKKVTVNVTSEKINTSK